MTEHQYVHDVLLHYSSPVHRIVLGEKVLQPAHIHEPACHTLARKGKANPSAVLVYGGGTSREQDLLTAGVTNYRSLDIGADMYLILCPWKYEYEFEDNLPLFAVMEYN